VSSTIATGIDRRPAGGEDSDRPAAPLAPIRLVDVDLGGTVSGFAVADRLAPADTAARLLVRLHGHPLGVLDLAREEILEVDLQARIWAELGGPIRRHLAERHGLTIDGLPATGFIDDDNLACSWRTAILGRPPAATVVINTCAASDALTRTIDSALQLDYPDFSIVVVDNRPARSGVARLLETQFARETRLNYIAEPRPGLGRARNAGLAAASTGIVAFTDDDVVLDRDWLGWLVAGFSSAERVACVTGLIVPLELETPAQVLIEAMSGFGKGFEPRIWDLDEHRLDHPLYPYTVGIFGSGASAAFDTDRLAQLGGFDAHLGIGTPACGGEDLDAYTRLILAGNQIVYQPASLLRHQHRRNMAAVSQQVRGYGAGLTAMLTKHLIEAGSTRSAVLRRIPAGVAYAISPRSAKNARRPPDFSLNLSLLEWFGMVYGPIGYLRSRLAG